MPFFIRSFSLRSPEADSAAAIAADLYPPAPPTTENIVSEPVIEVIVPPTPPTDLPPPIKPVDEVSASSAPSVVVEEKESDISKKPSCSSSIANHFRKFVNFFKYLKRKKEQADPIIEKIAPIISKIKTELSGQKGN